MEITLKIWFQQCTKPLIHYCSCKTPLQVKTCNGTYNHCISFDLAHSFLSSPTSYAVRNIPFGLISTGCRKGRGNSWEHERACLKSDWVSSHRVLIPSHPIHCCLKHPTSGSGTCALTTSCKPRYLWKAAAKESDNEDFGVFLCGSQRQPETCTVTHCCTPESPPAAS